MPLVKRTIEPVHVTRNTVSKGSSYSDASTIPEGFEAVTNNILVYLILQLSSLSKHAEDLVRELEDEAHSVFVRINALKIRLDRLSVNTKQLDSGGKKGTHKYERICLFLL